MTDELVPLPRAEERVYHYRRAGESFHEIAATMGMSTAEVIRAYRSYMTEMVSEYSLHEREHIVISELDRLDQLMKPFYAAGTEGEKEGAEVYLKIAAHRAKLLRLDQPTPDELKGQTQVIVVTGSKEEFEAALLEGQRRQVTGPPRDDGEEEDA